jgi:hypothetical protein
MTYKKIKTLENLIEDRNKINDKMEKLRILHNMSPSYSCKKSIYQKLQRLIIKRNLYQSRITLIKSTCDHKNGDGTSAAVSKMSLFGYKLCEICGTRVPKYSKKDPS